MRPRSALSWVAIVLGALALVPVLATLVLRQVPVDTARIVAYVAASPYVLPAALVAAVCFAVARAWLLTALAGVVGLVMVVTQLPLYVGEAAPADGSDLVVMTSNLWYGEADVDEVVALVREREVDVLFLQELTPRAARDLRAAGLEDTLPHSVATPRPETSGNGIWSRFPLTAVDAPVGGEHPAVAASVDLFGHEFLLVCLHAASPYPSGTDSWADDLDAFSRWLGALNVPTIVGADLNATFDHPQFRDLLDSGYRDAVEQSGAGFVTTYPANRKRLPPLIAIDHVLTRGPLVATGVDTVELRNTDHLAVVVDLVVAPD